MFNVQWRQFYTVVYSAKAREAVTVPISIQSEWVRVEIVPLVFPWPTWYRAGWINQVMFPQGRAHQLPGRVVPLAPSLFQFSPEHSYQIRFKPVPYLPNCLVKFYRSL